MTPQQRLATFITNWKQLLWNAMAQTGHGYRRYSLRSSGRRPLYWASKKPRVLAAGAWDTRDDKVDGTGRRLNNVLRRYTARYDSPRAR